jgi:hypothetical protein
VFSKQVNKIIQGVDFELPLKANSVSLNRSAFQKKTITTIIFIIVISLKINKSGTSVFAH